MRMILGIALAFALAGNGAAQHGGGFGGHGGGIGGIGHSGGIGIGFGHGGGIRTGHSAGIGIGHGGGIGIGYGAAFGHGYVGTVFGSHGIGAYYGSYLYPWHGLGYAYWPAYYTPYPGYLYGGAYPSYGYSYQPSPNVTVIYPPSQLAPTTAHDDGARPVTREYDEYGQETRPATGDNPGGSSPIYLIAFKDHSIRAASAYWVDGKTLHYVTLQHEEERAALSSVDREFSLQLNRERRVLFRLPAQ